MILESGSGPLRVDGGAPEGPGERAGEVVRERGTMIVVCFYVF